MEWNGMGGTESGNMSEAYTIQKGQKFTFKLWLGHLKLFDMAYSVLTLTVSQSQVSK